MLASHVSASAQSLCGISITLASDTLTYQDTYVCLPLMAENFQNVSELELSITLPDRDIIFRDAQMMHPSLSDMTISASNYKGKSIVQLFWTADEGGSVSIDIGASLGELCFDIIDYPHNGFELLPEGLGLQQGNSIVQDDESKLICVNQGRIESPCSVQKFRIHKDAQFRNAERCRNDTTAIKYPNHLHPISDLPMTIRVFKDGALFWEKVFVDQNVFEGFSPYTPPGDYKIFLWNSNGCVDSTFFKLKLFGAGTEPGGEGVSWAQHKEIHTCKGINKGAFEVLSNTSLRVDDSINWSTGEIQGINSSNKFILTDLSPGSYNGYLETEGCRAHLYFEILDIPTYEVSHNTRFVTCDGSDGSIWIETDPPGNYIYSWEGRSDTTAIIENLTPGSYQVTVTNPEGCEVERSIELPMTGYIQLEWESEVSFPDCRPDTKASRSISLRSNNIAEVDFVWSSGERSSGTLATAAQLEIGVQWVYAYTATCASDTLFFEVVAQEVFEVSIDESRSDLFACEESFGLVHFNFDSLVSPRFFDSAGVELTYPLSLPIGTHNITARSESGCSQIVEIEITPRSVLPGEDFIIHGEIQPSLCLGELQYITIEITDMLSGASVQLNDVSVDDGNSIGLEIGEYQLSVNNQYGCQWDTAFIIEERELSIVVPEDLSISEGQSVILSTSHDDIESLEYDWQATNTWSCNVEDCRSIIYNPLESETIYLNVRNESGCIYQDSIVVSVIDTMEEDTVVVVNPPSDDDFYIPNIISQGSSLNNEFCVALTDVIQSVEFFALYDRWGNQVALNSNSNSTRSVCLAESLSLRSQQLSSGVYVYVIQFAYVDGQIVRRSGSVTIL